MGRFESGTYVRVIKDGRIGVVESREKTYVNVDFYDKSILEPEEITFRDYELAVTDLPMMKTSQMGKFVRGEISLSNITNGTNILPDYLETASKAYDVTAKDLVAGLKVYEKLPIENIYGWLDTLIKFTEELHIDDFSQYFIKDEVKEQDIVNYVFSEMEILLWSIIDDDNAVFDTGILKSLRDDLEIWINSDGEDYPESIKEEIAFQYDDADIDKQSKATQTLFKKCLDYMCDVKKDPKAIQKRGYCYYCGTEIYPNNWIKARDAFIEYYQLTGDASAANTLGYIYYYGRCNGGVPEYEEAFKYFSIGHAYSYYESTYKLADMLAHGYGVAKDGESANHLYWAVYKENLERFTKGDMECNFADAALRMGNCFRDEIGAKKDLGMAYYYYLQADLAIRERVKMANLYGDNVVFANVQKALANVRKEYKETGRVLKFQFPSWINWTLIDHRRCRLTVRKLKNGAFALNAGPLKRYDEEAAPMMLITVPQADYCELKDKITIKTAEHSNLKIKSEKSEIIFDHVEYDWAKHKTRFYLFEDLVGELITEYYTFKAPSQKKNKDSGKMYHFVSIRFQEGGKTYDYLCEDKTVKPGDKVVVNGYEGENTVEVVSVSDRNENGLGLPIERYKNIIRKV